MNFDALRETYRGMAFLDDLATALRLIADTYGEILPVCSDIS